MSTTRRSLTAAAAALTLAVGLSGCSKEVEKDEVEKQITSQLQQQKMKVGDVKCDDDLEAEKGKSTECEVEINGNKQKVEAKVTKVDGDKVFFDITPKK